MVSYTLVYIVVHVWAILGLIQLSAWICSIYISSNVFKNKTLRHCANV